MSLSERLRQVRLIGGLGCRELDRLAGLGEGHVSMIETGKRPNIESRIAAALADVLGLSLDWLVRGLGPNPSAKRVRAAVERARAAAAVPPVAEETPPPLAEAG